MTKRSITLVLYLTGLKLVRVLIISMDMDTATAISISIIMVMDTAMVKTKIFNNKWYKNYIN